MSADAYRSRARRVTRSRRTAASSRSTGRRPALRASCCASTFVEVRGRAGIRRRRRSTHSRGKPNIRIMHNQERRRVDPVSATCARSPGASSCRIATREVEVARRDEVVTQRPPTEANGATCCSPGGSPSTSSPTRSCSRGMATLGVGAGQMSRVDSVRMPREGQRARSRARWSQATRSSPSPMAWRRGPGRRAAIIQPGGSIRDDEVIAAADTAGWRWSSPGGGTSATSRPRSR